MLLSLHSRVGDVIDFDGEAELSCGGCHQMCQVEDGKLLRELIIDAALASGRRIVAGNLDATHRIANVEETARLSPLP